MDASNSVSTKQLCLMIFFIPLVFKTASLPGLLYREASATAWLLIVLVTTLEFLQLALVLFVSRLGGMEGLKARYGAKVYLLVALPMLFIVFTKIVLLMQEIASYVGGFFFYNLPQVYVLPVLFVALFYLGTRGARAVGRCYELAVWLIPLIVVFGVFFGKADVEFSYLTPLFSDSAPAYMRALAKYLIYTFDFSPLLFFTVRVKRARPVVICSALSVLSVTACFALTYATYGNASSYVAAAFARLAAFNTVISEIGSLDSPSVLLWLTTALLSLALKIAAVSRISRVAGLKKAGVFLFVLALWLVLFLRVKTLQDAMRFATGGVQYGVFFAELLLPVVVLLFLIRRPAPVVGDLSEA